MPCQHLAPIYTSNQIYHPTPQILAMNTEVEGAMPAVQTAAHSGPRAGKCQECGYPAQRRAEPSFPPLHQSTEDHTFQSLRQLQTGLQAFPVNQERHLVAVMSVSATCPGCLLPCSLASSRAWLPPCCCTQPGTHLSLLKPALFPEDFGANGGPASGGHSE